MGDVIEQELVELGLHRENLYKRQHEAYESEERNERENRAVVNEYGTAWDM